MKILFSNSVPRLIGIGIVLLLALVATTQAQAATYFFHNDHLGTPQTVTDEAQQTVWQAERRPFGKVPETANQIEQNVRFPGQYFDSETGLHYNYYRDYDPSTGRYVESDPIGLSGGTLTYGYGYQNPIRYTDPSGLIVPWAAYGLGLAAWALLDVVLPSFQVPPEGGSGEVHRSTMPLDFALTLGLKGLGYGVRGLAGGGKVCDVPNSGLPKHSKHSLNQKINREVKTSDELDAIRNPLDKRPIKVDSQGRPSQRSVGEKAEVVVNPDTNTIVSVNPTSSKKAARLKRRNQVNQ